MEDHATTAELTNVRANLAVPKQRGVETSPVPEIDGWALAGLPGRVTFASYLTGRNSAAFRLIVDVLLEAQGRSLTGVARSELPRLLRAYTTEHYGESAARTLLHEDTFELDQRMKQLEKWGTVESWQDRAEREADFLRNRERYQLTQQAADLHRFVVEQERSQNETSTSALLGPALITSHLQGFHAAVGNQDHSEADTCWAQVQLTLADMQRAAHRWQSAMAQGLSGAPSADKIASLTALLRNYVEVWGASVDMHTPTIAALTARAAEAKQELWRALALHRVGAEAADDVLGQTTHELMDVVETLSTWFCGTDNEARRLRRQVRDAVPDLLRSHRTLLAVGGAVSRRAEVLSLAGRIERASDDREAWELWQQATGLFRPVHLALAVSEATTSARTSFWDASPATVDRRLRARGHQALKGSPGKIPDLSHARAAARHAAAKARRELAEAVEGILRRAGRPLSEWGELTEAEGVFLWELLSTARSGTRHQDGTRTGTTVDGGWEVRMIPASADTPSAIVALPEGVLVLEDVTLEVHRV
ncbi:DUF2397 domain-containing protein [Streptomyces sp. NPDC051218]|uniref:DUF2397 domain-containing protein n=1 Tax=Streptomyces sp. NPDC051218 TaxID=3365645 RepID=UPI0037A401FC